MTAHIKPQSLLARLREWRRRHLRLRTLAFAGLSWLLAASGLWFKDFLSGEQLFRKHFDRFHWEYANAWQIGLGMGAMVLFIVAVFGLYLMREWVLPVRSLRESEMEGKRALIWVLSRPNPATPPDIVAQGNQDLHQLIETIEADAQANRWNWLQILRAVRHHVDKGNLEYVVVIASADSIHHAPECQALLERLLSPWGITVRLDDHPYDFNQFEGVYRGIDANLRALRKAGIESGDIAVDCTGGTKPSTIAAALATLHSRTSIQYVGNEGSVVGYDLVHQPLSHNRDR